MRIIAGRWRGRRLQAPEGLDTRPTSDRVRESLFAVIGERIRGAEVIDLCCGSGGLGLEALSRGARRAVFVDQAAAPLAMLRRNLADLGAEAAEASVIRAEAVSWLRRELTQNGETLILLADPPYASTIIGEVAVLIKDEPKRLDLVVLECERGAVPEVPAGWIGDQRRYGRTELLFLEREA